MKPRQQADKMKQDCIELYLSDRGQAYRSGFTWGSRRAAKSFQCPDLQVKTGHPEQQKYPILCQEVDAIGTAGFWPVQAVSEQMGTDAPKDERPHGKSEQGTERLKPFQVLGSMAWPNSQGNSKSRQNETIDEKAYPMGCAGNQIQGQREALRFLPITTYRPRCPPVKALP
jgi:hypothetical protein